jgi:response regulator RpfG family c-di-GMP phosphodiesterase
VQGGKANWSARNREPDPAAGRGRHFDPDVVDAFAQITEQFRDIAIRYAD